MRSPSSNSVRMFSSSTSVRRRWMGACDACEHSRTDSPFAPRPRQRACAFPGSVTAESMSTASWRLLTSTFQRLPDIWVEGVVRLARLVPWLRRASTSVTRPTTTSPVSAVYLAAHRRQVSRRREGNAGPQPGEAASLLPAVHGAHGHQLVDAGHHATQGGEQPVADQLCAVASERRRVKPNQAQARVRAPEDGTAGRGGAHVRKPASVST